MTGRERVARILGRKPVEQGPAWLREPARAG
jgi:hypothetical protein